MELRSHRSRARRAAVLAVVAAGLLAGCSGDAEDGPEGALAYTDQSLPPRSSTTLIAVRPDIELDPIDQTFVDFEADWLCEIQKVSFASQLAQGEAQVEMMSSYGIDEDGYTEFRQRVEGDQELRQAIQFTYQETCRF